MLQVPDPIVLMYLQRATRARELARQANSRTERLFHLRMEDNWMKLSVSAALVGRVDLFTQSLQSSQVPYDVCGDCQNVMKVTTVETQRHNDVYTFRCDHCGSHAERTAA